MSLSCSEKISHNIPKIDLTHEPLGGIRSEKMVVLVALGPKWVYFLNMSGKAGAHSTLITEKPWHFGAYHGETAQFSMLITEKTTCIVGLLSSFSQRNMISGLEISLDAISARKRGSRYRETYIY